MQEVFGTKSLATEECFVHFSTSKIIQHFYNIVFNKHRQKLDTYFEHIQSSALNSPLLFAAACFPISAPVNLIESLLALSVGKQQSNIKHKTHSLAIPIISSVFSRACGKERGERAKRGTRRKEWRGNPEVVKKETPLYLWVMSVSVCLFSLQWSMGDNNSLDCQSF